MKRTLFVSRHRMTECPACHAHVRVGQDVLASSCGFCGAKLSAPGRDVFTRLLDMGGTAGGVVAAMLGLGLVRCSDAPVTDLQPDTGEHMVVPLYGIPPVDGGLIGDATIADAREPLPQPEYGAPPVDAGDPVPGPLYGISPLDAGTSVDAYVVDAKEPLPEPDYGIPPIHDDAAVSADAEEPVPEPLYGIAPVDSGTGRRDAGVVDADDAPPIALYGISPIQDSGVRGDAQATDADEGIPVPLYGGAAVEKKKDELLS